MIEGLIEEVLADAFDTLPLEFRTALFLLLETIPYCNNGVFRCDEITSNRSLSTSHIQARCS